MTIKNYTLSEVSELAKQFPEMIEAVIKHAISLGPVSPVSVRFYNHEIQGEKFQWEISPSANPDQTDPICTVSLLVHGKPWKIYLDRNDYEIEEFNKDLISGCSRALSIEIMQRMAESHYERSGLQERLTRICEEGDFEELHQSLYPGIDAEYSENGYSLSLYDLDSQKKISDSHWSAVPDWNKNQETFYRFLKYYAGIILLGEWNVDIIGEWKQPLLTKG